MLLDNDLRRRGGRSRMVNAADACRRRKSSPGNELRLQGDRGAGPNRRSQLSNYTYRSIFTIPH